MECTRFIRRLFGTDQSIARSDRSKWTAEQHKTYDEAPWIGKKALDFSTRYPHLTVRLLGYGVWLAERRRPGGDEGARHRLDRAQCSVATTKGRSCSFPTIARLSGPPFSAATGASTAGAVSSTPRAESDAQHAPAHSVVPKMRVPRSVRLRLRRQGRAS